MSGRRGLQAVREVITRTVNPEPIEMKGQLAGLPYHGSSRGGATDIVNGLAIRGRTAMMTAVRLSLGLIMRRILRLDTGRQDFSGCQVRQCRGCKKQQNNPACQGY